MKSAIQASCGILLIVNGTRNHVGQRQTEGFVEGLKQRMGAGTPVVPAYLEMQKPNLQMAFNDMYQSQVRRWLCVPLMLFSSGYAKFSDNLNAANYLLSRHADLDLFWMSPWGTQTQLISVIAGIISRRLLDVESTPRILLVAKHCRSSKVYRNYEEAARRIERIVGERIEPCVLGGSGTAVADLIKESYRNQASSILLVPYLAFEGRLLQTLREDVCKHFSSRRHSIAEIQPLFVEPMVQNYVYSQIAHRFYQEEARLQRMSGYDSVS